MSVPLFAKRLIVGLCFCASIRAQTPVTVYEASTNYSGKFNLSTNEYGDEIILSGNSHYVTKFQFEYFANFVAQGDEQARIRFYENTGPGWKGSSQYLTPAATPLWETTIPINSGFNTATITVPNVFVPLRFTWTVKFFGLNMTATDEAGLLFYGKPTVGSSFNDYWEMLTSGWTPERYSDIPVNNFAAKITAVSDLAPPPTLTASIAAGGLLVSWPAANAGLYLESRPSVDGGVWTQVYPQALQVGDVYQTTIPIGAENRIFRLNSQPQPPLTILANVDGVHVRWSAAVGGQKLQSKANIADATWTDLPTPTRPTGDYYEAVIPVGNDSAFFRLTKTYN